MNDVYCVNCGVKLADTEEKCPLCSTLPGAVPARREPARALYPEGRYPEGSVKRGAVNGAILILFLVPLLVTFLVDLQTGGGLDWFWFAAGGIVLAYLVAALPLWFKKPNPIIFVPCDFCALGLYLLLLALLTGGGWFFSFALPVTGCIGLIVTAVVVLLRCLRGGRLYIFGGALLALGAAAMLVELLLSVSFGLGFSGWSVYPLAVLGLLGGLLIFLAINRTAREKMERRFFV